MPGASQSPAASPPIELRYAPEVAAALRDGRPVVALESTIISHGALLAHTGISCPLHLAYVPLNSAQLSSNMSNPPCIAVLRCRRHAVPAKLTDRVTSRGGCTRAWRRARDHSHHLWPALHR
jgi:Indigoidine synthase A like protein